MKGRGRDELTGYDGRGGYEIARPLNPGMFREADVDLIGPYRRKKKKAKGVCRPHLREGGRVRLDVVAEF